MELKNFVFPRPPLYWSWETHNGELIYIPVKRYEVDQATFFDKMNERTSRVVLSH